MAQHRQRPCPRRIGFHCRLLPSPVPWIFECSTPEAKLFLSRIILLLGVEEIFRGHSQTFRDDEAAEVCTIHRTADEKTGIPIFGTAGTLDLACLENLSDEILSGVSTCPGSITRSAILTKLRRIDPHQPITGSTEGKRISVNRDEATGELPIIQTIDLRHDQGSQNDQQKQNDSILHQRKSPA